MPESSTIKNPTVERACLIASACTSGVSLDRLMVGMSGLVIIDKRPELCAATLLICDAADQSRLQKPVKIAAPLIVYRYWE